MKLTPLDIRKQEFSRRVRGVDEEEVKAFLQMVASQWEEISDEQRRLDDKVRDLEGKLEHYKQVEEALQEALRTARENAKDALDTARQKAQVIIQEAEANATHIKRDADDERRKMRRQIARLSHRRDEIVSRLRAFLMSEMEMLARFEGNDAAGFMRLMPALEPAQEDAPARLGAHLDETAPEPEVAAALAPEPVEDEEPEAPLPAWAQFDEELSESDEPAQEVESEFEAPEPPTAEAPSWHEPEAPAEPDAAIEEPAPWASPESAAQTPEWQEEWDRAEPSYQAEPDESLEPELSDAGSSDGDWVDHQFRAPEASGYDTPETESDDHLPAGEPVPGSGTPAMARWLNDHFFSSFKKNPATAKPAEVDPEEASDHALIDDHGWENGSRPHPPIEDEEEESFTVSSEEVERIRRILKGLD